MRTLVHFSFLLFAGASGPWAMANTIDGNAVPGRIDEHTLQEKYHIAPTKDGLVGALRHSDPVVRQFAAFLLRSKKYVDAAPAVLDALAAERNPGVKIDMAAAAFQLGSEQGAAALQSMCEDASWSPGLRMGAARSMLDVGSESCLTSVLTVLRTSHDLPASWDALLMLPRFVHAPPAQVQEGRDLASMYLRNKTAGLQMEASSFMRAIGDPWAAAQLRDALAVEQDEAVRALMSRDLSAIESSLPAAPRR